MSLKYFISVAYISVLYTSISQIQKGFDINGESAGDLSGKHVAMPDMNTVAIGAGYNDGNGSNSGHARVFTWSGSTWIQKGADIDGESAFDNQAPVDMPDANTIVVGSMFNDNGGQEAGQVRVFYWDGSSWIQKGQNINGTVVGGAFGREVCMPDVNTVASVGNCDYCASSSTTPDFVRVFQWNGNSWIQKGSDIIGWDTFEGNPSIDMPDANTIGINFRIPNSGTIGIDGKTRVYVWDGLSWVQKGGDIDGTEIWANVSMPDVNTIAIAEDEYDGFFGIVAGRVRIFKYEGNSWVQKGSDIQGEAPYDWFGTSISMPNSNTISVVARGSDINGSNSGNTYLFSYNGTQWVQLVNIVGEFFNDAAEEVSMPDATTIAIGASSNDGNGDNSGHVRVFSLTTNGIQTNQEITKNIRVYPNPANDVVKIDCSYEIEKIEMIDTRGVLLFQSTENKKEFFLPENTQSGCYVLVIHTPEGFYRQKLFIQK